MKTFKEIDGNKKPNGQIARKLKKNENSETKEEESFPLISIIAIIAPHVIISLVIISIIPPHASVRNC